MCYAKKALEAAAVGVFAFAGRDGRPRACAVTPFLYDGEALADERVKHLWSTDTPINQAP